MKIDYLDIMFDAYQESIHKHDLTTQDDAEPYGIVDIANDATGSISTISDVAVDVCSSYIGSIRALESRNGWVEYAIIQKDAAGFRCVKVSSYTVFAISGDVMLKGLSCDYLADPDNSFILSHAEVADSLIVDSCDPLDLLDLYIAASDEKLSTSCYDELCDLGLRHPMSKFRVQEYELTCEYRSRSIDPARSLWIPQVNLVKSPSQHIVLQKLAAVDILSSEIRHERPQDKQSIHHDLTHSLSTYADGSVWLIASEYLVGLDVAVFCGNYLVFSGALPQRLKLLDKAFAELSDMRAILNVIIIPWSNR